MEVVRIEGAGPGPRGDVPTGEPGARPLPLVAVTWRDAWFDFEQGEADEPRLDYLVTTVGFIVHEGPRFVSIAQELLPDGDGFRAVTHIPLTVIESVTPLEAEGSPAEPGSEGLYSADADAARASDLGRRDA
jgi:hypothetical protein